MNYFQESSTPETHPWYLLGYTLCCRRCANGNNGTTVDGMGRRGGVPIASLGFFGMGSRFVHPPRFFLPPRLFLLFHCNGPHLLHLLRR